MAKLDRALFSMIQYCKITVCSDSPVMKVTISFNGTKIVVPCADGEISVREVTTLAATRYKKAIGKTNSYWVSVASLKSHEGGILDADDLIGKIYFFTKTFAEF